VRVSQFQSPTIISTFEADVKHVVNTRAERAKILRPMIEALRKEASWQEAAELTGVSIGALRNLLNGSKSEPETLDALELWAGSEIGRAYKLPESTPRDVSAAPVADEERLSLLRMLAELQAAIASGAVKHRPIPPEMYGPPDADDDDQEAG
jgi:transcriptional regulator with XRE-family HTH domain